MLHAKLSGADLASLNHRSENVIVKAVLMAESEIYYVHGQVLGADPLVRADDTALEDSPEIINRWV